MQGKAPCEDDFDFDELRDAQPSNQWPCNDLIVEKAHLCSHSSSGKSLSSLSWPQSLPVLDDELEGGITDDAKEWLSMECNHLSGKPLCPKVLKSRYSRSMIKSTTSCFINEVTPHIFKLFGIINAWEQPSLADLQKIWRDVFSEECILSLQTTGGVVALMLVQYDNYPQFLFDYSLLRQIDDCLSQWRKRFGERKLEALEEITFNDLPTNDTGHQEWWCSWALTCSNGHGRTFYYAVYSEPERVSTHNQVLGMHMSWLSAIDEDVCSDKKPVGALIHAIQVAKHAIMWRETSIMVKPQKPLNKYSKANWGDHIKLRRAVLSTSIQYWISLLLSHN
ncbi:hypothetical protein EI94DRAFT_1710327 [Lactarius quietus]|nr:hypothetical protein EI94DRAFT_1710327 [Lactarius quietus]